MNKPLKVKLHILSPVHIGCDDVYEPTSFVIDEKKKKLIEFDPLEFIKSLSAQDRKKFTDICMQGNITSIVNIYKFLSNRQIKGREVEIANELVTHYKKVRDLPTNNEGRIKQELNQFTISRTAYNSHNNLPYIPGSSIKGAMRTGYLSQLAVEKKITGRRDKAKDLETELLGGSFDRDPFRMVKVSDFLPVGEVKTKIVYAVNKKKKASNYEARGPFQVVEAVEKGSIFEGLINIETPEKMAGIDESIDIENLLKSINGFYNKTFEQEQKVLKEINAGSVKRDDAFLESTIIRIGRHSGAESVTIEGNRHIKIMKARREFEFSDHATTLWLASETSKPTSNNGIIPFGWALLEIIPFDIKNIYPSPIVTPEQLITKTEEAVVKKEAIPVTKTIQSQTILWENAQLSWSHGDLTLKANNKAILKFKSLDEVKKFVPESFHKKLFDKRDSIKANIKVEQTGNAFKIISIET